MPDELSVAGGVASGANAFIQAFTQARAQKHQQKMQENMPVVELLMQQAADPNTSYFQRARIIDQIPALIGAKTKQPLSTILGYDKLNEKDFEVEEGANAQVGKQNQSLSSEQTNSPNQGQTLQLQDTQSAEGVPAITKKYGDTTPAEIHLRLQQQLQKANDKGDIDKQAKLLRINYQLQKDILGKGGYTQEVSRGYDANENYQIIYKNADGDTKTLNLGKFKSEVIKKAELTGANKANSGKFGQLAHANAVIDSYNSDPTSVPYSDYTAARQFLDDFEKTGQLKDSTIAANNQKVTGTQPIQPSAKVDDDRMAENNRIARQTSYDNAVAQSLQTSREAADFATQANAHVNNVINPLKERINNYLKEQGYIAGDPGSTEILTSLETDQDYKALQNQLRNEIANYEGLKSKADAANARDSEAKQKVIDAKNRLEGLPDKNSNIKLKPKQKAYVDQFFEGDLQKAIEYNKQHGKTFP